MAGVLVIEDDDRIRLSLVLALEDEGYVARGAVSAEEGLAAQRTEPADAVLIDLMLPGMDGFECIRELRRDDDVPIIVVSARDDTHDINKINNPTGSAQPFTYLQVADGLPAFAVIRPSVLAFEQGLKLVRSTAERFAHGRRVVRDGDRLLPGGARLQHAALVGTAGPSGVLVAEVDFDAGDLVPEA